MSKSYFPPAWYWQAGDGRIFSSAASALVPATDPDFLIWSADDTKPTVWPRDDAGEQTDAALDAVLAPFDLAASLPAAKDRLKAAIDAAAERLRLALITPGTGQAMEYGEAQRQAEGAAADANAAPAGYPMLAASIGIDIDPQTGQPASDVHGVARSVLYARSAWIAAGSAIRGARLGAKKAIDEADTLAAARDAAAAVTWPSFPA